MTALAAARDTVKRATLAREVPWDYPQMTNTIIYAGAMVALNATGYLVPFSTSTTLTPVGRANETKDATGISSGAQFVQVESGIFAWNSGTSGDVVAIANVGSIVYGIDDNTVGLTTGGSTRSAAGVVVDVDADGVWVDMSPVNRKS